MKKTLFSVLAVFVVAAVSIAVYRFGFRKSIPEAPAAEQVMAILKQNDCFVCHTSQPELPFYANIPFVGDMLKGHITAATRFTDLSTKMTDPTQVDEVTLAMIEHAITSDAMPMMSYKMVHWGTGFNRDEKSVLTDWVRSVRASRFANGLSCDEFACEPIFPLPATVGADEARAALGERMYNDTRVSLDGKISCATCHVLEQGGADAGKRVSEGIDGLRGGVNAPTVYNAALAVRQFWNGRAADLQEQAGGPATNPVEMGDQTLEQICERLSTDAALLAEFKALYPDEGLTPHSLTHAIAEFEKTLLTPDSRFDLYLKGDKSALTEQEVDGYASFKKNACATCHVGVAMGGQSFESFPIFGDYFADRDPSIVYNSDDDGLKGFTTNDADLHKFKVPTLRNVSMTAPYLHDGTAATLEDAVRVMAKYELGRTLSDAEVSSIVAFMNTLTGKHRLLGQ